MTMLIAALLAALAPTGQAAEIQYADFSDSTGLTINGDAVANFNNGIDVNPVLRLTSALEDQAGSAFSTTTVSAAGFSTTFEFRITDPDFFGADGLVFVVQPVSAASGTSGSGMGFEGITPSVGFEFDTFFSGLGDPSHNHLGIDLNGDVSHPDPAYVLDLADELQGGQKWTSWVDYNGQTLEVRANITGVRPAEAMLTRDVDIATLFGQDDAYIGFTAATGAFFANHDILSWNYSVTQIVWDGGAGSDSWAGGANWDGDIAPEAGDNLVFAGSVQTTTNNDLATVQYSSMSFADTAAGFTINGNAVQIADGGYIRNNSVNAQTINLSVTANGAFEINAAAGDLALGNLTIAGATSITGDHSIAVGGIIDGAGSVAKSGAGTLTLSGNNTYAGGTDLAAGGILLGHASGLGDGGLVVSGDASLGASVVLGGAVGNAVTINNGATLTINGSENIELGGNLDGAGALEINTDAADDVVTLSDTSSYTGGSVVTRGILRGNTTSLQGDITNNAAVIFDQAIDGTYAGAMSGTGMLTKLGAGTLTLSGANAYSGASVVTEGTLQGTATSLQGDITNNSAIVFDQAIDGTYAGVINGAGTLTKLGVGELTLSGASQAFSGATTIDAGTLVLNGAVGGNVIVNGARLEGIGTVGGNLTVNAAGTFAPGNSIGTTTIGGDYVLDGTLEIEVNKPDDATLEQDQVVVGGAATLASGSQISVTKLAGTGVFLNGDQFPIITTAAGVTDSGAVVTSNSVFLAFTGLTAGNNYVLTTRVLSSLADQASKANRSLAAAIDADSATAGGDYAAITNQLLLMNAAQFNQAARQLNAEPYLAAARTANRTVQLQAADMAGHLRRRRSDGYLGALDSFSRAASRADADGAFERDLRGVAGPMGEDPNRPKRNKGFLKDLQFFAEPFAATFRQKTSTNRLGYTGQSYGVQFGADTWLGQNVLAGLAVSYAHTEVDWAHGRGEGDVETLRVGPFATYTQGGLFLDVWATCGFHWNDTERDVVVGALRREADADYGANDASVYLGGGYDFELSGFTLTPTASLQYTCYRQESFRESGGGGAGLRVGAETFHSLRSRLGMRLARELKMDKVTLVPEVFAGWSKEYIDDQSLDSSFLAGGAKFTTRQGGLASDSAYFGAGVSAKLDSGSVLFLRYEAAQSSSESAHFFSAGINVPF